MKFFLQTLLFIMCLSFEASAVIRIAIEGNTGAGKTTLINFLAQELDASVVEEPFNQWLDVNGKGNLFQNFLGNGKEWSVYLCIYATVTKFNALATVEKASSKNIIFIDRSILSDSNAFGRVHRDDGLLSSFHSNIHEIFTVGIQNSLEAPSFKQVFASFEGDRVDVLKQEILMEAEHLYQNKRSYDLDGIIYLRTSPELCKTRADYRDRDFRDADSGPVGDFYQKLGKAHEAWIGDKQDIMWKGKLLPILTINGDVDILKSVEDREAIIQKVREFSAGLSSNQ